MKSKILYFDQAAFNSAIKKIESDSITIQQLVDEVVSLKLPVKIKNKEDLSNLVKLGHKHIEAEILKAMEPKTILGIPMKRQAQLNELELPSFTVVNDLSARCRTMLDSLNYLSFDGDHVSITSEKTEEVRKRYSVIASSKSTIELTDKLEQAAAAISDLNKTFNKAGGYLSPDTALRVLFRFSEESGEVTMRDHYFSDWAHLFNK